MKITVGTRVNCVLAWAGEGIISKISGDQAPETVESLGGGVMVRGGNAVFDVVFANGALSRAVPEAIIRGVQWRILPGEATPEEIAEALAHAACVKATRASAAQAEAERLAAEIEALKADPAYAKLTQGEDFYSGKLAAKNIRAELKAAFPAVRFSVRKRSYGAINVEWTDGPTDAQVSAVIGKYGVGHYDAMQDLHTTNPGAWNKVFGGVDYLFTRREVSPALKQRAIDDLFASHGGLDGIEKPTPDTCGRFVSVPGENFDLSTLIRSRAAELEG